MKIILSIFLFLFFLNDVFSQSSFFVENNITKETAQVVKNIETLNEIPCIDEYYKKYSFSRWKGYEDLKKIISHDESIKLLEYPNSYVKAFSFFTLLQNDTLDIFPILVKNLHHHDLVVFGDWSECVNFTEKASDFFITAAYITQRLSEEQIKELQKLIITKNIKIETREDYLYQSEPKDSLYSEIRKIALVEKNKYSIFALSKYQKQQDKHLIIELIKSKKSKYWGFSSINNFLSPDFLPLIEQYLKKEMKRKKKISSTTYREAYKALIQYDNQKSLEILEFVLAKCNKKTIIYHKQKILEAIRKNPSERYNHIQKELEQEGIRIY